MGLLNDEHSSNLYGQVSYESQRNSEEQRNVFYEQQRPSVIWRPRVFQDGNQWCALYGSNLMEGVAGFGDSPDAATRDFDREWFKTIAAEETK